MMASFIYNNLSYVRLLSVEKWDSTNVVISLWRAKGSAFEETTVNLSPVIPPFKLELVWAIYPNCFDVLSSSKNGYLMKIANNSSINLFLKMFLSNS